MYSELDRRRTFVNWPKPFISTDQLAQFGFYHYGGDKTKCAFCNVVISDWDIVDTPLSEHLKHSPHCPLLNRHSTQNIPIDEEQLNQSLPEIFPDECGPSGCSHPSQQRHEHYEHPDLMLEVDRRKTFNDWPKSIRQKPRELAEAGFFYTGQGDMVICFSCGLGLRDWDIDDNPIVEHAKYTTDCMYLNLVKGTTFVENVKEEQIKAASSIKTVIRSPSHYGQEENEISMDSVCKICYAKVSDILLSPCNHCASCGSCSVPLKTCPVCRRTIEKKTKIFFS